MLQEAISPYQLIIALRKLKPESHGLYHSRP